VIALRDNIRRRRLPLVTIALAAGSVIAYVIAIGAGGSLLDGPTLATVAHFGAIPYEFTHLGSHCDLAAAAFNETVLCTGQAHVSGSALAQPASWETAFTAMFLHANLAQLTVNMAFLAVFGATLEDALGRPRFLAFYLLGGLCALALAVASGPDSSAPTLGASGAISAVLGGYILLFPRARVLAWLIELPAWAVIGLWLILGALFGALGVSTRLGGTAAAYYEQLGGFAFGLLAVRVFTRGRGARYGWARTA
jgi:membrane associated rhomboid family serine protease